jgi:uncharacterized membrane protein
MFAFATPTFYYMRGVGAVMTYVRLLHLLSAVCRGGEEQANIKLQGYLK